MKRSLLFSLVAGMLAVVFINFQTTPSLALPQEQFQPQSLQIQKKGVAQVAPLEYTHKASDTESVYADRLETLGITLHPGSSFKPESDGSPRSLSRCKSLVYRTLKSLPKQPVEKLKHLTLYFSDTGRRGLGGGDTIILRCQNVTDEELSAVLVHEIGHVMDTGVLQPTKTQVVSGFMDGSQPVYTNDPSVTFYRLSWKNNTEMRKTAQELDFVSGYAMADPFEDFSETYAYYVLHGQDFRKLATSNNVLQQKYNFMKYQVFDGKEYGAEYESEVVVSRRHFDVTVLPYDLDEFLVI